MKNINMVKKYRNSKLGRAVVRLFGEETGAVMMEYVVVAVVIAAACALIMAVWGKAIFGQANVAIHGTQGATDRAVKAQQENRTETQNENIQAAADNQNVLGSDDNENAHAKAHTAK